MDTPPAPVLFDQLARQLEAGVIVDGLRVRIGAGHGLDFNAGKGGNDAGVIAGVIGGLRLLGAFG